MKTNRSILQRWKRTMHVPLRLDVYYQHPQVEGSDKAGERELLERWCLEYAPTGTGHDGVDHLLLHNNNAHHVDPIVQLRRVCKHIVVWLRTLYCHSRLLPAQALRRKSNTTGDNNSIGFSIYVVSEGQDDVSGLLRQGFDSQPKQSQQQQFDTTGGSNGDAGGGGVQAPYGVLGWKVYLAPN